jgi:hypothetical protein
VHGGTGRASAARQEVRYLLEVAALCGLAIAQPVLDVTGRAPDFFLFHGARFADIAILVALVTLGPPAVLWGIGLATRAAGARARRGVHLGTVGALCAALAVQVGRAGLPVRGWLLALLAVAGGVVAAAAYARWRIPARALRLAAVGPPLFVLLFAFASPTSALVRGGSGSSGPGRSVGPHPPMVVLLFDELPQLTLLDAAGRIDAARFPSFAALAADSTWYRNATTVRGFTPYAVPSMLTGRYPTRKAAPHHTQYPDNLFTLLAGQYDLRVRESVVNLCPPSACPGSGPTGSALPALIGGGVDVLRQVLSPVDGHADPTDGFTEPTAAPGPAATAGAGPVDAGPVGAGPVGAGPVGPGPVGAGPADGRIVAAGPGPGPGPGAAPARPDDGLATFRWTEMRANQPSRFRDFVAGLRRPDDPAARPVLHFLHLLLPHKPFRYLPSGVRYPTPALPESGDWWARLARQRHVAQARYADRLLGEALRAMRESGLYDRATVVVTADHGIAFTARKAPMRNLRSREGAAEIGWVPLFIKEPGQRTPREDHRNWLHIDLLPTLADHAGLAVPWRVDGISGRAAPRRDAAKPFTWDHGRPLWLDPGLAATVLAGPDDALALPEPPRPDLVGRPVDRLPRAPGGPGPAPTVLDRSAFDRVAPAAGTVPALVRGDLPDAVPAGRPLAVALNGVVAAVVPVLPRSGARPRFAALIDDGALFRTGANRLELFLVEDAGLRPLPLCAAGKPGAGARAGC